MTYTRRATYRRYARRRPSMGDWLDDILADISRATGTSSPSGEQQCIDRANAAIAPLDAKIDDLVRNWNPTGFYTPADMRQVMQATMQTVQQAQAAVDLAAQEPNASQDSVIRATNDLARAGARSLDYLDAARRVEDQGLAAVNAPGLKRWVTDTLAAASSAMVTASVIGCITPWWVDAMAAYQAAFDRAWSLIKRVVGAVLAIGETALKIADDLPALYDLLKWGLLIGAGYLLFVNRHEVSAKVRGYLG